METIISYKKLSCFFLFPGIIYGKIQQLAKWSTRNWPLKENIRERNCASIFLKVEVKKWKKKWEEMIEFLFTFFWVTLPVLIKTQKDN